MNSYPGGLNHFFDATWPSAAQIKKATSTQLFLDPTNGSDNALGTSQSGAWKTGAKLAQAIGEAEVNQDMVITLLGDMAEGDRLVIPNVGRSGRLSVKGTPEALLTSTATTGTAGPTNTAQTRGQIKDSAVSSFLTAGPSGSSLINKRVRIASGARAGALGWLLKASAANTALTQQLVTADTTGFLTPADISAVAPQSSDPYVVEGLPTIPALEFRGRTSGDTSDSIYYKIMIADLALASTFTGFVPKMNWPAHFVGCYLGALGGNYTASACHLESPFFTAGDYITLQACLVTGFCYVEHGAQLLCGIGTIFQGANLLVEGGHLYGGDFAVFDCAGAGATFRGGEAQFSGLVWGSGNTGRGWDLRGGARVYYTPTKPSLTGAAGFALISNVAKLVGEVPYFDTTAGSGMIAT